MKKSFRLKDSRLNLYVFLKIFLVISFFTLYTLSLHAQNSTVSATASKKINLSLTESTLRDFFTSIEKDSGFRFFYDAAEVNVNTPLSVNFKNTSIQQILDNTIPNLGLSYKITGNQIIIKSPAQLLSPDSPEEAVTISGLVTDKDGEPLIGVSLMVKGSTTGTVTNVNGEYSMTIPRPNSVIQFSYIGYTTLEINARNIPAAGIIMKEDLMEIEEVVVVGYGTQKKETLTGSVVAVKGKDLVKSPAVNISSSLAGRLAGVTVSSRKGQPGDDDASILIRGRGTSGNNDALVIIDGVERSGLGQLNPNDIESISILKDASAAIYGSRAANGVILITTKRGDTTKPIVNFSYNQGLSQPVRTTNMADSYTYAKVYNEIELNEGRSARYTDNELQKYRDGSDPNYPNTHWYDFIVKKVTPQHRTNLSVSGMNERTKYYLSFGELMQKGQYKEGSAQYKQYTVRSNVDVNVSKNFRIGMNLSGKYSERHAPITSDSEMSSHIYLYQPNWQPYWPGTNYMMPNRDSENILNMVSDNSGTYDANTKSVQSTLFFKWQIPQVEGLSIEGSGSYDFGNIYTKSFSTPAYVYYLNSETGEYEKGLSGKTSSMASLTDRNDNSSLFYLVGKINYEKTIKQHSLGVLLGYEQTKINGNSLEASRSDFISTAIPQLPAGSSDKEKQSNTGGATQDAKQNYFGRLNYNYAGKYLAEFTMRIDGSPNFPSHKRWGYFPSVSVGWRLSEESFMKKYDFINNLKIRGSFGLMGNDRVNAFQYLMTYKFNSNYVIGNNDVLGLIQNGVPNPNITWETAKTWNFGFDATLWNGLFGMEFDAFKTRRSDILTKRSAIIPDYTGLQLPDENIGIVDNKGFEMILTHSNQVNGLRYSLSGNISFARNKVIFSDEQPAAEPYQMATGRPYGTRLYYKAIGIFKDEEDIKSRPHMLGAQPGDIIYEDVNKDGVIDSRDRIRVDQTNVPEILFGLNATFEYKGFDLSILLQGQERAKQYFDSYFTVMSYSLGNFTAWRAEDRWSPENTNATMPRGSSETWNNNTEESTQWLINAGFLRLKNLELGYSLPSSICRKIGAQNLRVSVSGSNLFLIYDHMKKLGFDPETEHYWYYPQQRVFNFGVNLTF